MTTRRKPLPPTSPFVAGEASTGVVRPSTSGTTSVSRVIDHSQNPLPFRRRSEDNYFDILDTYANDPRENEEPPSYQQFAPVDPSQHQEVPHPSHVRPQLRTSPSAKLLRDDNIIQSSLQHALTTPTEPTIQSSTIPSSLAKSGKRPKLVTALEETSFFLGGFINHPVESTKSFTILRHSHGLVYYKGPETSIAISIFSSQPLPPSRRLWLQLKGWSGNTGMAAKALFRFNNNWINVTPETQISASDLQTSDERAWQRDIKKFQAKATKTQQKQKLRETALVRIPFEASDGYFRLVLTAGDSMSVLCPSPVFRVASTSMSASSIKGASLSTLPIELGVRAAQTAANIAMSKVTAAATPLKAVAQSYTAPVTGYAGYAQTAWDMSGMQDHVDAANDQYNARWEERMTLDRTSSAPRLSRGGVVGDDAGPTDPFPIRLSGIVAKGSGTSTTTFDMPTANLDNIPADLLASVSTGVYFGWALVVTHDPAQINVHEPWRQAIITVSFTTPTGSKVAQRKTVRAYLLHEFPPDTLFIGSKLKLCIMGYLRPLLPPLTSQAQEQDQQQNRDIFTLETINDISIARASLSRPSWGAEQMLRRAQTARSERGITDRLVDARVAGQRRIDKIPVHVVGVRNGMVGVHDRGLYGNGGVWVKRD